MESMITQTNIKALAVSAIVLLFTYWYYIGKAPSFLSFGTMVAACALLLAALVTGALVFKGVGRVYAAASVYPHPLFRLLFPLLILLLVFWLGYGITSPGFSGTEDFMALLKRFLKRHLPYILVVAAIVGVALSLPFPGKISAAPVTQPGHWRFAAGLVLAFAASLTVVFLVKRISQPALEPHYLAYLPLGGGVATARHEIHLLLDAGEAYFAGEPNLVADTGAVIINVLYPASNKLPPLKESYRISEAGEVVDHLVTDSLSPQHEGWVFDNGIIRGQQSRKVITWAFDQRRIITEENALMPPDNWKITRIPQDTVGLKMERFFKTAALHCNERPDIKWNGSRYYAAVHHGDTIRFKVDDVFGTPPPGKTCRERTVAYFTVPGKDYALIRLEERMYFIIRPLKK